MKKQLKTLFVLLSLVALPLMAQYVATSSYSSPTIQAGVQVKTGICFLYDATMFNNSASTLYFMVFDTNAAPATGSAPTLAPIQVPAGSTASYSYRARPMSLGLYLGASTTPTNYTAVSSNTVLFDVSYNTP